MSLLHRRSFLIGCGCVLAVAGIFLLWRQLALVARLLLGGMLTACVLYPVSQWFAVRLHLQRPWAICLSFLAVGALLLATILLLLPPLVTQTQEIIALLPVLAESARTQARQLNALLLEYRLPALKLPEIPWERLLTSLPPLLDGTASLAGSVVNAFTELTLMLMLGYYFLRDRERVLLYLELAVPSAHRRTALRMAASVRHEIVTYLRGQALISGIVALLAALLLLLCRVQAFLALGVLIGLANMIPYFGPLLGAIPAILMALTQGLDTALLTALALFALQQLDGMVISPRVMGTMTGLHPALVLISITVGGSLMGVAGMLLAIPFLLAARAISRVWVSRSESI